MCKLCDFLDDDVLGRLETHLVVIQLAPLKGWRQKKLSVETFKLLDRFYDVEGDILPRLTEDCDQAYARYKVSPTEFNREVRNQLDRTMMLMCMKLGTIKGLINSATPWLSVMEA
ncbi:hypothetical protein PHOBOS_135 [Erwinia phage vB_EamM_Phobos]|uniref:hypothetical protein n=1 Tax=Erwinia phage vB_EamM_Phobos TaxID=1883377 RepID=UPI00081D29DE|nr:hypothetical protein BIZ79_gp135 [Erwinia phage vB_EamM_Phobos]ANZ50325.1 hypothetical protein PHOBOS_135 [Erwinia phage vB_EamM_Phobos]